MTVAAARLAVAIVSCIAVAHLDATAATRYDPRLRFSTISTARFDIHYHQGEEALARRLARIAEDAAASLDATLGPADGRVQVILVDQTDLSNGWATPLPYNTIEITAASPPGESLIGNTDDWLRLVFVHEYTHVVHLGRAGGWIGGLRRVFGRLPVLYPNLSQPLWAIEGIATWRESVDGGGRLRAGDFRQLLARGAASGRFEPLDRASGRLVDWPSGNTPYLYGGFFHEFLARRYGDDSIRRLTDETARRLPYLGSRAYKKVFGRSLGDLWSDFEADAAQRAVDVPSAAQRLTRHGFYVSGPRVDSDGTILYSVAHPHGFPALMAAVPGNPPRELASRYLGNRVGLAGPRVVFDQLETVRNVGLQSDLHVLDRTTGRVTRLTREARAGDPDVAPDGRTIVCTVQHADRRALGTLTLPPHGRSASAPSPFVDEADADFASPRWSPDGRWIAAERRRRATGPSEIVLIDAATRALRVVAAAASGRAISPAWLPDSRALLFASDAEGGAFRIYRADLGTSRIARLEGTGSSAQSPAVSRDGGSLVYVGYTADGFDLFQLPLASAVWSDVRRELFDARPSPAAESPAVPVSSRPYSPFRTLWPRFWTPTLESDEGELVVGAATGSLDALGRHAYGLEGGWSSSRARPDWQAAYLYDRWWPTVFVAASDDTDPWRDGEARTRELEAGVLLPVRRVRWSQTMLGSFSSTVDTADCASCDPPLAGRARRRSLRGGWAFDSAKAFGYSISPEQGARLGLTAELTREALGSDGNGGAATVDVRRYFRVPPRHAVVAVRAAAAAAWGDSAVERVFTAAGNGPQPGGFAFGSDAIGLLRGFDESDVSGRRAAVVNIDYRVPLLRVERGAGTVPLFLRTIHAAVFFDAGHAWSRKFRARDGRVSVGGELSFDAILGFALPVTFTTGAAWRHGRSPEERGGVVAFGRIGRAF